MDQNQLNRLFSALRKEIEGDLIWDTATCLMYATDASAYREIPLGVARPRNREDIRKLILFARQEGIPLIPRTAGTSLAGQVVGSGLIVDVSRYMTHILEINPEERWVRVEPGVILDELNLAVAPYGLFFGPETSTSSRCMIGGMTGNNSCGAHSLVYGSTRDHLISARVLLSDGSDAEFREIGESELAGKLILKTLEGMIYRQITTALTDPENQRSIREEFPDPAVHRRNTGYAIDLLLEARPLNLAKLLAGSEGTLAFLTEIKLNLVPLPPKEKALVCVHCRTIQEALKANLIALQFHPGSVELMDKSILDCTRENITQRRNRFFLEGDPGAILIVEFSRESRQEILDTVRHMENMMKEAGYGYAFPLIFPPDLSRVWALRKAGLGVLSNYPGDRKPVAVTEDTAVAPAMLPAYIDEFAGLMEANGLECVYHAHVGSGELHLRPVLNLKDQRDTELFHTVALESARLVKKYKGSLSGEHGDGRLRGEFIPLMIGERNYAIIREIKRTWDPESIFNPGKITDTPPMNTSLRYKPGQPVREVPTFFDFSESQGILRAAEQCNGSGDCRNTHLTGAGMCPSYMALREENATTRARANILREFLTHSTKRNPFDHPEIHSVMDLCLSCKACKSECPSNVDMTRLKAEFLQHWYDARGIPLRSWMIAHITQIQQLGSVLPGLYNYLQRNRVISGGIKSLLGFAKERSLPLLGRKTLRRWLNQNLNRINASRSRHTGSLYLFVDEFTNYNDTATGIAFVELLRGLGYKILTMRHPESGRTYLSKGFVRKAALIARKQVQIFHPLISAERPLVGLEPSAILSFRDEYPDLVGASLKEQARETARHALLFDEFLEREMDAGRITSGMFRGKEVSIRLHGHCHQKAVASVGSTVRILSLPSGYQVKEIQSGCCGMAGSFGYEKEHYDVSMKVGELSLFPAIRMSGAEEIIAAPGTSCRHQISDGTGRKALHPVEILRQALTE